MKRILLLSTMVMLCLGIFLAETTHVSGSNIISVSDPMLAKTSPLPLAPNTYPPGLYPNLSPVAIPESVKMLLFGFILVGVGLATNRKRAK